MDVEREEWVGATLREVHRRRAIDRVLSVEAENAVPKGANYASDLVRLKLKVVTKGGQLEERSVVFKALPSSRTRKLAIKAIGIFFKEARVYQEIFPEMERILKACEPGYDLLWAECYGVASNQEGLLFQDLSVAGYKMGDRMKGLDFEHSAIVMESLAKFHALGAVLLERGDIFVKDFQKHHFVDSLDTVNLLFNKNFVDLAKTIEDVWKGEWSEYAGRLRNLKETFSAKLVETFENDKCPFRTLLHGDCWLNNMLFKYNTRRKPLSVKFVDFQLTAVGSPGHDLQYFINTSLQIADMGRKSELLQVYHDSLLTFLTMFDFRGDQPSLETVLASCQSARLLGLGVALAFRPLMMQPETAAPDMEELTKAIVQGNSVTWSNFTYDGEDFVQAIRFALIWGKEEELL